MTTIYLVRHGKAAAAFDEDRDPPLDETGLRQALAMADRLGPLGPLQLVASPMRRTRETAAALEQVWGAPARIEPRVTEVPSPDPDLPDRRAWLRTFMTGAWSDPEGQRLAAWREELFEAIRELSADTVIVSHFVAINTLVGGIRGDERVTVFHPDNCSITRLVSANGTLSVAELGKEMETEIF